VKKTLLIIEKNPYGSLGLKKASELGVSIVFLGSNKYYNRLSDEDRGYIERVVEIDSNDPDAVIAVVNEIRESTPIHGVMTFMEFYVPLAARIAEQLGLPGIRAQDAANARDKALMRQRLAQRNVAIPAFSIVSTQEDAIRAASAIGYPNILKPVNMSGSRGVMRNDSESDFVRNLAHLMNYPPPFGVAKSARYLVEEYMDGPEFSVESISYRGEVEVVAITKKYLAEPTFVEIGHLVPADLPPEDHAAICALTRQAVLALGIRDGGSHTEIKLTRSGPKIVEVAARLGGGNIPELVELATGVDLWKAVIQIAMNEKPALVRSRNRYAAVGFFTAQPGLVTDIKTPVNGYGDSVHTMRLQLQIGTRIKPLASSADRFGYVIASGDTPAEATRNVERAKASVQITVETPATA